MTTATLPTPTDASLGAAILDYLDTLDLSMLEEPAVHGQSERRREEADLHFSVADYLKYEEEE